MQLTLMGTVTGKNVIDKNNQNITINFNGTALNINCPNAVANQVNIQDPYTFIGDITGSPNDPTTVIKTSSVASVGSAQAQAAI